MKMVRRNRDWPVLSLGSWLDPWTEGWFDNVFGGIASVQDVRVDIVDEGDKVVVTAEVPGVDPNDIDLDIDAGVLTIKGSKKKEEEVKTNRYVRIERSYGSFERSFTLPQDVDQDNIQANYKNGVLRVVIDRTKKIDVKKIEIKQEDDSS